MNLSASLNMNQSELIRVITKKVKNEACFNFSNIDGCKVKCSSCQLKFRFDNCVDKFFGFTGGCDCIIIFKEKTSLIECKSGKFGSKDAKKVIKQIIKCFEFIRSQGYDQHIEAVIYFDNGHKTSMDRVKTDLKSYVPVRFNKCGKEFN